MLQKIKVITLLGLIVFLFIKMEVVSIVLSGVETMTWIDVSIVLSVILSICIFYLIVWTKQKNKKA